MLLRLVITAVFGSFGLVLLYVGLRQYLLQRRLLSHANPVEAEVVVSEVQSSTSSGSGSGPLRKSGTTSHVPVVRFRYQVHGTWHESDLLRPTSIARGHASRDSAAAELTPYPVGARVIARVNPALPDKGYLLEEASAAPVVFIILGILVPPLAWFASALV